MLMLLACLFADSFRFNCLESLTLPASNANKLAFSTFEIIENRLFYLDHDSNVHIIGYFPDQGTVPMLKPLTTFEVLPEVEKDPDHSVLGILAVDSRLYALFNNGSLDEKIDPILLAYDLEGNLIFSKEIKRPIGLAYLSDFHLNSDRLLEIGFTVIEMSHAKRFLNISRLDKKGNVLFVGDLPLTHRIDDIGGTGFVCKTSSDQMVLSPFVYMSEYLGRNPTRMKVSFDNKDEPSTCFLSSVQFDKKSDLFIIKVENESGNKLGSLRLQLPYGATFFTLPGGSFGYIEDIGGNSLLKLGFLFNGNP